MAVRKLLLIYDMDCGDFLTVTNLKLKLNRETLPLTEGFRINYREAYAHKLRFIETYGSLDFRNESSGEPRHTICIAIQI